MVDSEVDDVVDLVDHEDLVSADADTLNAAAAAEERPNDAVVAGSTGEAAAAVGGVVAASVGGLTTAESVDAAEADSIDVSMETASAASMADSVSEEGAASSVATTTALGTLLSGTRTD